MNVDHQCDPIPLAQIVEITDIVTRPESWGRQLATIAQVVISGAVGEHNDMTAEEAEALIQKGWADFWGGVRIIPLAPIERYYRTPKNQTGLL